MFNRFNRCFLEIYLLRFSAKFVLYYFVDEIELNADAENENPVPMWLCTQKSSNSTSSSSVSHEDDYNSLLQQVKKYKNGNYVNVCIF
jgi:hypothetical protein